MNKEFTHEVRVSYRDTDQMGVVYYANYFAWFEVARTELLRAHGITYRTIEKERRLALPAVEVNCKYRAPARYDDIVVIKTKITELKNTSLRFEYEVFNKESNELLATASSTHVFIDENRKPVRIPDDIRKVVEGKIKAA